MNVMEVKDITMNVMKLERNANIIMKVVDTVIDFIEVEDITMNVMVVKVIAIML